MIALQHPLFSSTTEGEENRYSSGWGNRVSFVFEFRLSTSTSSLFSLCFFSTLKLRRRCATRREVGRWVVVVVVDSHIQRIVLASEETTVTQQVSHRPIKCQSRLWSQRGTRVNGSHHGDNPLLRPTGIQIATKSYAALQAMAPTNIKTVHQTSILHIESNLDRLGMLSPTHDQRSQQKNGKITEKLRSNQF